MKCKSCHHKCHCDNELHADEYGICVCDDCKCNDVTFTDDTAMIDETDDTAMIDI